MNVRRGVSLSLITPTTHLMMKLKLMIISVAATALAAAGPNPDGRGTALVPEWLDTDGDGVVSEREMQAWGKARKDAVHSVLDQWDTDGNGEIDGPEREAAMDALRAKQQERLEALFNEVAASGETSEENPADEVSLDEFAGVVPEGIPAPTVELLFGLLNTDGGDTITLEEFLGFFGGRSGRGAPDLPGRPNLPTP